jgi:nitrogen regulatory protein P-II 1
MKKLEAIIKEELLEEVKEALDGAGFKGMTVLYAKGRGNSGGVELQWRAGTYKVDFLNKILLMLVVQDDACERAAQVIMEVCRVDETGGAGKIFVSTVEDVYRIRTGQRGAEAL